MLPAFKAFGGGGEPSLSEVRERIAAAEDYVARSPKQILLIDGEELARLMVRHGIGVRTQLRYEVKRIDEDYSALVSSVNSSVSPSSQSRQLMD